MQLQCIRVSLARMEKSTKATESPKNVFARRMRRYREKRRWSQEDLAQELTVAGWKVDRAQLARIESGDRGLSLDEALRIAWVLSVPPALLYLPLGDADEVAITPNEKMQPIQALQWVTGDVNSSPGIVRDPVAWSTDMALWWLYDRHAKAVERVHVAQLDVDGAEMIEVGVENARVRYLEALRTLAGIQDEMRTNKLALPTLHKDLAEALKKVTT